jgi:hypothetical protein
MRHGVWIKGPVILGSLAVIALVFAILPPASSLRQAVTWQRQASPGRLAAAHAHLEDNCAACHTAFKGPDPAKCISCHASNESLLKRQPTAFHAHIDSCRECHLDHRGIKLRPTDMDHVALAKIGLRWLNSSDRLAQGSESLQMRLLTWIDRNSSDRLPSYHPEISVYEAVLNCSACHANQDRHFRLFGEDCAHCHSTGRWTIPEFRHPSPRSTDCAQCHQAPPSHYMEHFQMVSAKVAGKPHARVNQCYLCHQTTSWNDIKGVGWYKHH